ATHGRRHAEKGLPVDLFAGHDRSGAPTRPLAGGLGLCEHRTLSVPFVRRLRAMRASL
ncbi:MAG: hypothetical protein AVDCRST_MAG02-3468, partial [uncultured Rubrobacteraceae bacterium]